MTLRSGIFAKNRNQFLRETIGKILVAGIAAGVDQRQHGDGFLWNGCSRLALSSCCIPGSIATEKK